MRTRFLMILPLLAPLAILGCGDSGTTDGSTTPPDAAMVKGDMPVKGDLATPADLATTEDIGPLLTPDSGTDAGSPFPAPPTIGAQIDRLGRAGVNTALTDPFDTLGGLNPPVTVDGAKDAYNSAADPFKWDILFHTWIRGNLAILDGLDGICGNQAGANMAKKDASRYDLLATALSDDELYVNTASGTCGQYLGVELAALGIVNTDCGGRTPLENTIDLTYSLLATGMPSGVSNGILKADGNAPPMPLAFPFLGAAN